MSKTTESATSPIWVKALLALCLTAGMLAAGYLSYSVWDKIRMLDRAHQDHTEWVFFQLEIEYLKLDRAVDQARSGKAEDLKDLRKRFDIFYSRVEIAGQFEQHVSVAYDIQKLRQALEGQFALIDAKDATLSAGLDRIAQVLKSVESLPRSIALQSIAIAAEISETERNRIVKLTEILALVALIIALALLGAIARLMRQTASLNRASAEAQVHHLQLSTTLRASLDAVVVIDSEGVVKDFNGSAEDIFRITKEKAVGQSYIDLLIPPNLRSKQHKLLENFQSDNNAFAADAKRREYEMIDQNGRVFPVEFSVSLARSGEGPIFVTYIRDITEKRRKEIEITQARDDALAAYREKSRFFAMMSHEMRTPLNGVLSALQLLGDGRLDPEQQRYHDAAVTSGEILLSHINDVLAIERSEAGTNDEQRKPCDIGMLTSGIIGTMVPLATTSGTKLHLNQEELEGGAITTDPRAIQQILVNLLSNAIKFSPSGNVTLRSFVEEAQDGAEYPALHLEVIDDGPGIPENEIARIFEDFVSLDSRYERQTGGTGLGLGIVQRLVKGLDGEIDCVSVVGTGTRFIVKIPAIPASEADLAASPLPAPQPASAFRLNLLVADDNRINRDLLEAMLHRMGHDVMLAAGGIEAVQFATEHKFDAILMDISMPDMNGIQATQMIRSGQGPNSDTHVVAVTAHALPKERAEFKAAGMTGFIQKPLDMKVLAAALMDLHPVVKTASFQPSKAAQIEAAQRAVLNEAQVRELLDVLGREKLSERLAKLYQRVDVDIPALVDAKTIEDMQVRSHALAGMCGMFGADRLYDVLHNIETACKNHDEIRARTLIDGVTSVWSATRTALRQRVLQ